MAVGTQHVQSLTAIVLKFLVGVRSAAQPHAAPSHMYNIITIFQNDFGGSLKGHNTTCFQACINSVGFASSYLLGCCNVNAPFGHVAMFCQYIISAFFLTLCTTCASIERMDRLRFMFALLGVVNAFPAERAVFLRETQDKLYHPAAFYFAKVFIDTHLWA